MSTSKLRGTQLPDVHSAMEQVLGAEQAAVDAIAASQRRADELVQAARARSRRIAERARARIAALERAHVTDSSDDPASQAGERVAAANSVLSEQDRRRLERALSGLVDELLGSEHAGP